jgi:DNA-binding transcriptional regulator YhcF (GntR family)
VAGLGTFAACPDTNIRDERLINVIRDRIRSDLKELFYLGMSQEEVSALLKELLTERGGWK